MQMSRWMRVVAGVLAFVSASSASAQYGTTDAFQSRVAAARASMLSDPRQSVNDAVDAYRVAMSEKKGRSRSIKIATAQWLKAEALLRMSETRRAMPLIRTARATVERLAPDTKLHGEVLLSSGFLASNDGNVASSLADYQQAYRIFSKLKESRYEATALIVIGMLYQDANDWNNALKYFARALEAHSADPGLSTSIYNGRGNSLRELGQFAKAELEFAKAVRVAKQMDSPLLTATVLNNAARTSLAMNQSDRAAKDMDESLRATRVESPPGFRAQQLAILAQIALQRGQYRRSESLLNEVFAGVDLTKTTLVDREAHRTAYETYRRLGRADLALAHLAAWKRLDDDATELARSNSAALMAARFDFANQEVRIAKLKATDLQKTVAYERDNARTQRQVLGGAVATALSIIALLAFFLVIIRRRSEQVRAANDDLALSNAALGKALAAKTEFLATTSHEIRTPLNGILGMTQVMLADKRIGQGTRERLTIVNDAGITMRSLVDDILDVAKMETGNLSIENAPFALVDTLKTGTMLWEEQARGKGLSFAVSLDDCPGRVIGDVARVRQIVFNLLSNAVKFTPRGDIRLTAVRHAGRYRVIVADTGIGIAPEHHEAIFESFRQADTSMTRRFGGTGLGLSICRNLARAMGGDVIVESEEGAGAVFTLDLPLVELATETPIERAGTPATLVLDRNPITRAMLVSLFCAEGHHAEPIASLDQLPARIAAGGVERIVADDTALGEGEARQSNLEALITISGSIALALLWRGEDPFIECLESFGVHVVVPKPVARERLVRSVVGSMLVTQAA